MLRTLFAKFNIVFRQMILMVQKKSAIVKRPLARVAIRQFIHRAIVIVEQPQRVAGISQCPRERPERPRDISRSLRDHEMAARRNHGAHRKRIIHPARDPPVRRFAMLEGVVPSESRVLVSLRPGQAIEGRSGDYSGRVIAHQGDLQHEGRAANGVFRIGGLPPGAWRLRRVQRSEDKRSDGSSVAMEWEVGPPITAEAGAQDVALR